jgi:hypothetical protein
VARQREPWQQMQLFESVPPRPRARQVRNPIWHLPRTLAADPAVARASEEAEQLANGIKLGLARILAQRSAEERDALRALLSRRKVA